MDDDVAAAPPRLAASRPLGCRIVGMQDATTEIRIVRLRVISGGAFRFSAGQYARLAFGEARPREFSLASRPDQPELEFHIRHGMAGGAGAHAVRHVRMGDPVWLEGPFGDAWWRSHHRGPVLAVAGGTGLAPIKSIVETALRADPLRDITVWFGARDAAGNYLDQHFHRLAERHRNFRWSPLLCDPCAGAAHRLGLVTEGMAADLAAHRGGLGGAKAYVAGPRPMVLAAARLLQARGLPPVDIHADGLSDEKLGGVCEPATPDGVVQPG